jgi:hypothetical protein
MFHSVNGDRRGMGRAQGAKKVTLSTDPQPSNKGDRGFSDRHDAKVFLIGSPKKQTP